MKASYPKIKDTNFFNLENYTLLLHRLESLTPNAPRQWGTMNPAQMLRHLNMAIGSGLGYFELANRSNFLSRTLVKYLILNVIRKFIPGTKTPSTLVVNGNYDFEMEKKLLKEILQKAYNTQSDADWKPHTFFGKMKREEWGKLITIHVHHHLVQFGI
jgi:Protein of unknown function (DUF1569)